MIFIFLIFSLTLNNILLIIFIEKEYLYRKQDDVIYKLLSIYFFELFHSADNGTIKGPPYNVYKNTNIHISNDILILRCKDDYILKTSLNNLKKLQVLNILH